MFSGCWEVRKNVVSMPEDSKAITYLERAELCLSNVT